MVVADTDNNRIRKVDQAGTITTGGTWTLGLSTELITGAGGAIALGSTTLGTTTEPIDRPIALRR
jgi:hypothetical protein